MRSRFKVISARIASTPTVDELTYREGFFSGRTTGKSIHTPDQKYSFDLGRADAQNFRVFGHALLGRPGVWSHLGPRPHEELKYTQILRDSLTPIVFQVLSELEGEGRIFPDGEKKKNASHNARLISRIVHGLIRPVFTQIFKARSGTDRDQVKRFIRSNITDYPSDHQNVGYWELRNVGYRVLRDNEWEKVKQKMAEMAEPVDWRPTETIPEDYYAG